MSGNITKLIFAGLDKAGKTTIYKATMEEMDANDLKNLAPTKQIERHATSYLDKDFSVWDMGGQLNYREAYLNKPEVFNQTKAMIFVIDIQDIERLEESYQYFVDILQILKNVDPAPKLYVLFHKYDPEISGRLKAHFYKAARLFRKADKLTPQKFKFYLTSIFSNSIDLAVKRILFENFEDFEEPSQKLTMDKKEDTPQPTVPVPSTTPATNLSSPTTPPKPTTQSEVPSAPLPKAKDESFEIKTSVTTEPVKSSAVEIAPPAPPPTSAPVEIPTTRPPPTSAPPKAEIPVKEVEKVKEEKAEEIKKVTAEDKDELADATPPSLFDLSDELVDKLTEVVEKRMQESEEIVALSILSTEGKQVLAIGKNALDYERLETLKEVVMTLNPKEFFKELADIEYRGLGHFTLSDFDIYFARANQDYGIAILAIDVSTLMLQNAQRIVDSIRQGLGMMDISEEAEPEVKKKDLVSDLRSRLKQLSSLSDLDKE
ncbi:MAG: hypothetical protein GPJ54_17350 [Candidatus Heimdallarchaeota archaeon]|nr:hypothetical protein [Candidatus Heimdallarchaeota archaeon]